MAAAGGAGVAPNAEKQFELYVKKFADVIARQGTSDSLDKGIAEIFRYMNGIGPSKISPLKKIEDPALKARILNTNFRDAPLLLYIAHYLASNPALAEIITLFHEHGANMNIADTRNANLVTHVCINRNSRALVKILEIKSEGAPIDINIIDTLRGYPATPLYHAMAREAPALVELLLAEPDIEPNGFVGPRNTTVLYEAAYLGHHNTVRHFLENPRVDI